MAGGSAASVSEPNSIAVSGVVARQRVGGITMRCVVMGCIASGGGTTDGVTSGGVAADDTAGAGRYRDAWRHDGRLRGSCLLRRGVLGIAGAEQPCSVAASRR